jgi:predicted dehydrogenase
MKRRDFLQKTTVLTAASIAASSDLFASDISPSLGEKPIGYAFVGLGSYANYIAPRLANCRKSKITALVSSDRAKAKEWATRYQVNEKNIYTNENLDAIISNKEVDAVYIATPVGTHAEFAVRALKAGKHVLTEKTMAASVAQAQQMIAAAESAGKKLMVGYRARFEPYNQAAIQFAREETYGKVTAISAHKGFFIGDSLGKDNWRTQRALAGGGALVDIGIYSIQACRYIAGVEPVEVMAFGEQTDERLNGLENNLSFMLKFPNGILASGSASWNYSLQNYYRVGCTKGFYQLDPATSNENLRMFIRQDNPSQLSERFFRNIDQIPAMFDHFSECILENKTPATDGYEGLKDLKVIEAIYQSMKENKPVRLG